MWQTDHANDPEDALCHHVHLQMAHTTQQAQGTLHTLRSDMGESFAHSTRLGGMALLPLQHIVTGEPYRAPLEHSRVVPSRKIQRAISCLRCPLNPNTCRVRWPSTSTSIVREGRDLPSSRSRSCQTATLPRRASRRCRTCYVPATNTHHVTSGHGFQENT